MPEPADRRVLALLTASHLFDDVNQGAVPAMLPFFIAERHLSYAAAGGLVLAATVASSVVQPVFGQLADRRPAPWLVPAGIFAAGGGLAAAALAPSYWLIFLCIAVSGIGVAAFHPEGTRLANFVAGDRRATNVSIFSVGGTVGFALGPLVTTQLLLVFGVRGGALLIVPSAAMALLLLTQLARLAAYHPSRVKATAGASRPAVADAWGPFGRLTATIIVRSIIFYGLNTFIPLYWIGALGQSMANAGAVLTLLLASGAVGTLIGGRLADRYGRRIVVIVSMACLFPLLVAFTAASTPASALVLLVPVGVALFAPFSVMVVMGQEYLPNRVGMASAVTLGLGMTVGGLMVPALGWTADQFGIHTALAALTVLPLVAVPLALWLPPAGSPSRPAAVALASS
ncbi:MAG TPA: MFS transporter [Chloroflexota bacterium]|nr:MFS transporter [Chloroflexota bacterium]